MFNIAVGIAFILLALVDLVILFRQEVLSAHIKDLYFKLKEMWK